MISRQIPPLVRCILSCILLFTQLYFVSCTGAQERAQPKLAGQTFIITTQDGKEVLIDAELARSEEEKTKGLMFRKKLSDGAGMLFVYQYDTVLSFWMKNTLIPLSIAYIDRNGVIAEIHDMMPKQLTPVQSKRSLRYALEVPQGWFARAGISEGAAININEL